MAMIEIESLRQRMEEAKAAYTGPDPQAFALSIDKHIEFLRVNYGTHVPLDHAFKMMKNLEGK